MEIVTLKCPMSRVVWLLADTSPVFAGHFNAFTGVGRMDGLCGNVANFTNP
jgi:hypothetical protein